MKYDYDTDEKRIIKLVTKQPCSFNEIKLVESINSLRLSEILHGLEKEGSIYSMWKHEKILKDDKPYTRMRRIYLISNLFQLSNKHDNTVSAIKPCRTINSRMCNNANRK
ncbi:hypothetical protein NADRNF5_2076 [Nitrosopumilus adriaticus]|uniref:Uncharacterized protein n=2 Tax=Nitrosopumilus adriaticus TaxID=1580092 RepID=A0A0D5C5V6_9ARCH|nr:hypothetical protein NADRNF5_2076 [Nitrosopumilus adriaticus]